jgi:hypothetical protein
MNNPFKKKFDGCYLIFCSDKCNAEFRFESGIYWPESDGITCSKCGAIIAEGAKMIISAGKRDGVLRKWITATLNKLKINKSTYIIGILTDKESKAEDIEKKAG